MDIGSFDFINILPEGIIIIAILLSIVFSLFKNSYSKTFYTSIFGLLIPFFLYAFSGTEVFLQSFYSALQLDKFNMFFILLILFSSIIALIISQRYISSSTFSHKSEFCIFLLSAVLGAVFLAKATDLISIFVSLELMSISTYFLIYYGKNAAYSIEAVLKYFIYSSVTTAFLVYGFSLLYGVTTKTSLPEIYAALINNNGTYIPVTLIALLMIFVSISFKTSLIPFHMWTSDVYKGASPAVNIFLSCSSKFAVFSLLLKLVSINAFAVYFVYFIAILTITIGSLLALRESNIKKLMAYSTVAQAGFILSGLVIFNNGYNLQPFFYYMFIYMIMNIGCWIIIELFSNEDKLQTLKDMKGLFYVNPFLGFGFAVLLTGLAGLPVTAGFFSKYFLLQSIFFSGEFFLLLFFAALINTIFGVFYYLKILKYIFSKQINRELIKSDYKFYNAKALLLLCIIMTLWGGFYPDVLKNYTDSFSKITSFEQINIE